ncbi:MAG: VOC family protein [Cellulomonas sp.]
MATRLNPYLNFRDTARQAMEFYQSVFGGELTVSTFAEFHASDDPAEQDKVMHSQLTTANGLVLMGADTPNTMSFTIGTSCSVSLFGQDDSELRGYWDKLTVGATISEPLATAPWGDSFGTFTDAFGVSWLVNISGSPS